MITLKSPREIEMMADSGAVLASVHRALRDFIKPGITSWDIELFVHDIIKKNNAIAAQIGFEGYKYATCCSINDEICHGFPRKEVLKDNDLIKVDMCVEYKGAMSDSCWAYVVGESTPEIDHLMAVTEKALYLGIEQAQVGNRIGDIGHAIQTYVEGENLSVVRDFIGHGIGPTIHEAPQVPHYGEKGKGLRLKEGMVITIEPMVNTGTWQMKMDNNGWTARTKDGGLSCQYEHTLAITKNGPKLLTLQD
ncbi:type I methionyl aminopeptidase [Vagococcus carniphilus]|uniref:Methionine aminopeptidase n=1 Tax=Vagococcus carniphilus TaxID=218144 RepID=A0AAW8U5M7_9ENTE|nr:type I methionyl aminopeptidase [Vagococcus carniphilus]MDT2813677.1 type I methionyl aminopeptidase [Vagococcus carniphilus]MDT2833572.1 type I methionyl aminopeptidase [Vagococcus carniphilus]MDT2838183.1 type I methionyl aminopeptidase [Vagococcus carniphilus]MDT2848702.1 type I methionyl aminopeptidase [Vagococcus carniphilus]MDT2865774.1 type I methionyl aminopeptidase [Vagococcus carniphilus]